ncbi:MAG TPA: hypothetical protein VM324_17015 [Egibacteraceae bacterium]|nr:hypothetical protein [Egibacteraceae bacterium]
MAVDVARILDTTPDFVALARAAFLKDRVTRGVLWEERYRARHPEVFAAYFATYGDPEQVPAVTHKLSDVRRTVEQAAPVMPGLIEEVEPAVRDALGLDDLPEPLHVLMVGTFSTNACVARVDGDVAVLHCLEWFGGRDPARVLVAHEDTHAWHETLLGARPPEDLAWTAFAEGLAIRVSREVVPDRPPADYFWYGVGGFEDWLPWCEEHRDFLMTAFRDALDAEGATEAFFGAGFVDEQWRTGFYVADQLVSGLGADTPELVRMGVDEGREAIRAALRDIG